MRRKAWRNAVIFSLASNAAVLMVLFYAAWLWPVRLPANSQNIFWLASGVNTAGLLLLGLRWWPVILLNAFPAWLLAGEMLDISILGSVTNAIEALVAAWLIRKVGGFRNSFANTASVGALILASMIAPLVNTLVIPAWFCLRGVLDWNDYFHALGNWNLANGAAILMTTPVLVKFVQGDRWQGWSWRMLEVCGLCLASAFLCIVAFSALFSDRSLNFTFLAFPLVVYTAMRFGTKEVSFMLVTVMVAVYVALALHAQDVAPVRLSSAIWFTQAFCCVLSATGLLVAALSKEKDRAEGHALQERARALEISLSEERSRLETMRYQMHPHFLFNSLNSIYSSLPLDAGCSRSMLTKLSRFLRSTLKDREGEMVSLEEEIELVRQYLDIERERFGDDLSLEIHPAEDTAEWPVPSFLLQPLIENAIIHGFNKSRGRFVLRIFARREGCDLALHIENTGEWKSDGVDGIGLGNTRRRLELLYGNAASLAIVGEDGFVDVQLRLPLIGSPHLQNPHESPDPR